ncbi:hypothetical protein M9458_038121, partial [Cirrhinus mrigala]
KETVTDHLRSESEPCKGGTIAETPHSESPARPRDTNRTASSESTTHKGETTTDNKSKSPAFEAATDMTT